MVRALHGAGFEVIMDVVFNHTCEGGNEGPSVCWRGLDNLTFYRQQQHHAGELEDTTGCGNTIDFTNTHNITFAVDSLSYWAKRIGIDGFRFDLGVSLARLNGSFTPYHPFLYALRSEPLLGNLKLIMEPWDLGNQGWRTGQFLSPFAEWNDRFRDATRKFWVREVNDGTREGVGMQEMATRLCGSADLFATDPGRGATSSVNFVTAHDGFTLADLTQYANKHNDANGEHNNDGANVNYCANFGVEGPTDDAHVNMLRERARMNMLGTMMLSLGTPMMLAGDEFNNSQGGNNNAYCQDNEISWTNWDLDESQQEMLAFVSKMIHLRLNHPVLHRRRFFSGRMPGDPVDKIPQAEWFDHTGSIMDMADWQNTHAFSVMIYLNGSDIPEVDWYGNQMVDNDFILIFNAHYEPIQFTLPDERYGKKWKLVVDTHNPDGPELNYEAGFAITAQSRSFLLLMSDRKPEAQRKF